MIYLDTQSVLWLYQGDIEKFSLPVRDMLASEELVISPMVALELNHLYETGKIGKLPKSVLQELHEDFALNVDRVDFAAALDIAAEERWTRDPFDRIIAAHAKKNNAILITSDRHMRQHYKNAMC